MERLTSWLSTITATNRIPLETLQGSMDLTTNENVQNLVKGCIDPEEVAKRAAEVPIHKVPTLASFSAMLDPAKQDQLEMKQRKNYLMCLKIRELKHSQLKLANHVKLALGAAMLGAFEAIGMDTHVIITKTMKANQERGCDDTLPPASKRVKMGDTSSKDEGMERIGGRIYELETNVYNLTEEIRDMKQMISQLLERHAGEHGI